MAIFNLLAALFVSILVLSTASGKDVELKLDPRLDLVHDRPSESFKIVSEYKCNEGKLSFEINGKTFSTLIFSNLQINNTKADKLVVEEINKSNEYLLDAQVVSVGCNSLGGWSVVVVGISREDVGAVDGVETTVAYYFTLHSFEGMNRARSR